MIAIPHLGLIALVLILASAARWFWRAWRVNVPRKPGLFRATWGTGLVLGCIAYYQSPEDPFAVWAIGLGILLVYLVSTGAQKVSGEMVEVGDTLPSFSALDENGDAFDSSDLAGKRVLLKFFRGHWWPYCVAELRRWEELRPLLDKSGIQVVTVSTDKPAEIRVGHSVHGLGAIMLADPELKVIEQFGFRNKNLNNFRVPGRPGLPVPTTLLIDSDGKVVWKDQSPNYTQRSDPDYVGTAINDFMGSTSKVGGGN
jgi:peroxiredoxin